MTHDLIAAYWYVGAGFVAGCVFVAWCGAWYGRRMLLRVERAVEREQHLYHMRWRKPADPEVDRRLRKMIAEQPQFRRVRRA